MKVIITVICPNSMIFDLKKVISAVFKTCYLILVYDFPTCLGLYCDCIRTMILWLDDNIHIVELTLKHKLNKLILLSNIQ